MRRVFMLLVLAMGGSALLLPLGSRTDASAARSSLVMGIRRKVELTGVSQELASPQGMPADGSAAASGLFPTDDMNGMGDPSVNLNRYKKAKATEQQPKHDSKERSSEPAEPNK